MKFFLAGLILALGLTGCIPLRQQALVKGSSTVSFTLGDDRYLEAVQIGSANVPNHHKILAQKSYIESPAGKRYSVEVKPHQFDIDQKFIYARDDVFLHDINGLPLRRWSNGIWSIHLAIETDGETAVIDQQWKFWTFYYNPIIHGPPN